MDIQKLIDSGYPEHIIADGIIYSWLYMAGSKRKRIEKGEFFKKRFQLSGLDKQGKNLAEIVKAEGEDSLLWAAEILREFLPDDMRGNYLDEYVKFIALDNSLCISEYHILNFISDLFGFEKSELESKLQRFVGVRGSDLKTEQHKRNEKSISPVVDGGIVKSAIRNARRSLKLGSQNFILVKAEQSGPKTAQKVSSEKTSSSSKSSKKRRVESQRQNDLTEQSNWIQKFNRKKDSLTQKHAVWAVISIIGVTILWNVISNRATQFQRDLRFIEHDKIVEFDVAYQSTMSDLRSDNIEAYRLFRDQFNREVAYIDDFETFFGIRYEYSYPSLEYVTCLEDDVKSQLVSDKNKAMYESRYNEYRERFGMSLDRFIDRLEGNGFNIVQETVNDCADYLDEREYYVFNEAYWRDIESVLMANSREQGRAAAHNFNTEEEFERDTRRMRNQLRAGYQSDFADQVEDSRDMILQEEENEISIETDYLGSWSSTSTRLVYQKNELDNIFERAEEAQWGSNNLWTGATPYSNCYGSNNSCTGLNCTVIEVTAGGQDVVVTIKNRSDRVVRHGYIRSGSTYSFDLPTGSYQTHFYSGRGWNPNMTHSEASCQNLRGGFVNGSFSKDPDVEYLGSGRGLTYELRTRTGGNFSTRTSNSSEAF